MKKTIFYFIYFLCIFYAVFYSNIINQLLKYALEKYVGKKLKLLVSVTSVKLTINLQWTIRISIENFTVHKPFHDIRFKQPIILSIHKTTIKFKIVSLINYISNRKLSKLYIFDSIVVSDVFINIEGYKPTGSNKLVLNLKLIGGEVSRLDVCNGSNY